MNNPNHQKIIRDITQGKYRGSYTLNSRTLPRYPEAAERELRRINRMYMKIVREALQNHLPEVIAACKEGRNDSRYDAGFRVTEKIRKIMLRVAEEIEQKIGTFGLEERIEKIAKLTNAISLEEWRRSVKKTLGIDLLSDYYKGEVYAESLKRWTAENVLKIKSLPNDTLGKLEQVVVDGYQQGKSTKQLQKEIQEAYDVDKRKAELLARDQISTLNSQITRMQQTDAGVKKYRWSTSRDGRVRECHAALEGKVFSWDDPPEMWYSTKHGVVHTGRCCHPGEDYACRCVAIPIFDWQSVDVPIGSSKK